MVKKELGFPFSYGDQPGDDDNRLSHKFVAMVCSDKFKDMCMGVFTIIATVGQLGAPVHAIPPEAGGHAAAAADAAVNNGEAAKLIPDGAAAAKDMTRTVAGAAAAIPNGNGMPQTMFGRPPGTPGGPPAPGQPPVYMPLPRPMTPLGRGANTIFFGGSVAWICVNAYWGNPIAIAGCTVMVATWFANVLGVRLGG